VTFHCTVHSTEAVFRSPVSINVSSSLRSCAECALGSCPPETSPNGRRRPCSSTLTLSTSSTSGSFQCNPGIVVAWYLPNRNTTACSYGSTVYATSHTSQIARTSPTTHGNSSKTRDHDMSRPRRPRRQYSSNVSMRVRLYFERSFRRRARGRSRRNACRFWLAATSRIVPVPAVVEPRTPGGFDVRARILSRIARQPDSLDCRLSPLREQVSTAKPRFTIWGDRASRRAAFTSGSAGASPSTDVASPFSSPHHAAVWKFFSKWVSDVDAREQCTGRRRSTPSGQPSGDPIVRELTVRPSGPVKRRANRLTQAASRPPTPANLVAPTVLPLSLRGM
jgi:hypothetical protein